MTANTLSKFEEFWSREKEFYTLNGVSKDFAMLIYANGVIDAAMVFSIAVQQDMKLFKEQMQPK